jgi:hypothetical protein
MYEVDFNIFTQKEAHCDYCEFPCATCGSSATECTSCPSGWLLYEKESTCYEEINWMFPFFMAAGAFFVVSVISELIVRSTNLLHSVAAFLGLVEVAVWGYLGYLFWLGKVEGDRSLSMVSLGVHVMLNLFFIPVHAFSMFKKAAPEYH